MAEVGPRSGYNPDGSQKTEEIIDGARFDRETGSEDKPSPDGWGGSGSRFTGRKCR